ncbi:uncharacterized protein MYCGRDRAFT_90532 [Zymoseptoria tritici IPO323]|uniref:Ca2+-modulated nonselective cation channel polycystin n=1 Tax=Zymoseptoria tritici (strain CBS 115943 / IPO323) TaxID=336722 RepID=F9X260_ZYMTI|nr:uncharacterized protein MYCGRDRAFT_90532 [Zymoseptoria tritici IPO323]EGP89797.1 hypothetical protein MYCGRDRAFT_90532 [Zymoseptoria tritici IPO323]
MVLKSLLMSALLIVPTHAQSSSLHNSSIPTAPRSETSPSLPITSSGLEQTGTTKAVTLEPPKTSCPAGTTTVKSCWTGYTIQWTSKPGQVRYSSAILVQSAPGGSAGIPHKRHHIKYIVFENFNDHDHKYSGGPCDDSLIRVTFTHSRKASWLDVCEQHNVSSLLGHQRFATPVVFTTTLPEFKGGNDLGNVIRKCHDVSRFPGHGDLSGRAQRIFAVDTCEEGRKVELSSKGERIAERKFNQESFVNYDFYIHWIPGCRLKNADGKLVDRQKVDFKTTSDNKDPSTVHNSACMAYFVSTYKQCNNEGVGGSIEAGCLKYTFTGGRFEVLIDYWNTVVPV